MLLNGLCYKVGNGRNITIRDDPWIPDIEGFRPRPRGNSSTNFALVADLIDGKSKQWDHSKVLEAFDPQIVTKVLNIHISLQEKDDKICWALLKIRLQLTQIQR